MKRFLILLLISILGIVFKVQSQIHKRTEEELRVFRDKITSDRLESQYLLKTHKLFKEQGKLDEAAKLMERIISRKERLNKEIAEESGLSETYLQYKKATQRKKHPFASTGEMNKKSRIEWETASNNEMKDNIDQKCKVMIKKASILKDAEEWKNKISIYQQLQEQLFDQQLQISQEFENIKTIKDLAEKKAFLEKQKALRNVRHDEEIAKIKKIDVLHKELSDYFGVLSAEDSHQRIPDL